MKLQLRSHISPINTLLMFIAFGWLLLFAHDGLMAPFSGDDLMNLHGYLNRTPVSLMFDNLRYWSTSYRPLGGLFYVALYSWFGFEPLPFRVACFALLGLNLSLLWRFTLRLSGSREVAFLALLIAGYHAWFVDLYYSTGTVYDLLCYCFYLGAFNVYLEVRVQGLLLEWRRLWIVSVLYVCALNAKEMAVSLPVMLAAYEIIYHRRALLGSGRGWLFREGRGVLVTGLLTLPYVAGKLMGAGSLVENPAYRLTISAGRYLDTFHLYLNPLLYQEHVFRDPNTIQLLLGMLVLGLWIRSRPLLFGWCFLLVSLLPVAFIAHYSGFFLYLPMAGWSLYAAVLLVMARRFGLASPAGGPAADRVGSGVTRPARLVSGPTPPAAEREDSTHFRKCTATLATARQGNNCPAAKPAPRGAGVVHRGSIRQGRILPALPDAPALPGHEYHRRANARTDRARAL